MNKTTTNLLDNQKDGVDPLQRAFRCAGRLMARRDDAAAAVVMIELWVLDEEKTCLVRPKNAFWISDDFQKSHVCVCTRRRSQQQQQQQESSCRGYRLCQLIHQDHPEYLEACPVAPGVGLPGILWSEQAGRRSQFHVQGLFFWRKFRRRRRVGSNDKKKDGHREEEEGKGTHPHSGSPSHDSPIVWRDVKALANDPDQAWDDRLQLLAKAGIGWAAAVPFSSNDGEQKQGVVIFMAQDGGVKHHNKSTETTAANDVILRQATDMIVSASFCNKRCSG